MYIVYIIKNVIASPVKNSLQKESDAEVQQ